MTTIAIPGLNTETSDAAQPAVLNGRPVVAALAAHAAILIAALTLLGVPTPIAAQAPAVQPVSKAAPSNDVKSGQAKPTVAQTAEYVIGADDVLSVVFWRDKDMSGDVTVRPDGRITLPLINEVTAAGLTPEQLRDQLVQAATKFLEEPNATVIVKQINSRKVFILGEVAKPGPYPLTTPTNVLQLIAIAGGLTEYAKREEIVIMRSEGGKELSFPFDYAAVARRRHLEQNIALKPGDTVIVP